MYKIIFILLFFSTLNLFAKDELYQKYFEYKTLSPLQKQIFDAFIE
jgi:hypothetical protein